ncbi:MAG: M36 family metallopeptidase [Gemmataceae bacterium]
MPVGPHLSPTRSNSRNSGRRSIWSKLRLERLETRITPTVANYFPPSQFVRFDHSTGALMGPLPLPSTIALSFLAQHAARFGLTAVDFDNALVTSQYTDADTGMTHVYLRQTLGGLQVNNADMSVAVLANGAVYSAGGGFVPGIASHVGTGPVTPQRMPQQAVSDAAAALSLPMTGEPQIVSRPTSLDQHSMLSSAGISLDDIPAHVHYVPTAEGGAELAWDVVIRTPDGAHWYDLSVADSTGSLIAQADWIDDDAYQVLPPPNESPQDGGFASISGPADPTASPFGWHDTDGVAGPEFTDTRGNNVDAHLDRNGDNVADPSPARPSGGASLDFSGFTFDPTQAPSVLQNENAAMVNLFYINNVLHDIHYKYGFTEAAGNFQVNNYGNLGIGNDAVQADAQDNATGGSANNANFGTPADGSAPRMQMFEWTSTTPRRDSDLDNSVIIHEYGHGVSNRLTGGAANAGALNALQSGGMGEGWSDFYALMVLQRPTDQQNDGFGIGTYVVGQPQTGQGIRRKKYSYDMTTDPLTFDAFGTSGSTSYGITRSTEVHNTGELWTSTLWDLNWLLINKYGYDSNLLTGWSSSPGPANAGNKLMLKLVMEAMKLQPANPSFIQARDAIIAADQQFNNGADLVQIWTAFARRGLGNLAATSSSSATTITVDFSLPPELTYLVATATVPLANAVVSATPANYQFSLSGPIDTTTLSASDLTVNSIAASSVTYTPGDLSVTFSFAADPVATQGLQTIHFDQGAFKQTDGKDLLALTVNFRYDVLPMKVVSTSPAVGAVIVPPLTTIDINLNEPVDPATVNNGDLAISQGTVSGFTLLNSNQTIRYALGGGIASDGPWTASIAAGSLTDVFGNPNLAFGGSYVLDFVTEAFPTPLIARQPLGSQIYDGSLLRTIAFAGDTDSYTLNVDAGQTITIIATPSSSTLQPTITLLNPASAVIGTSTATAAGQTALVQSVAAATSGTYTIVMGGAASTTGVETIQVMLNAAAEMEGRVGSVTNNTRGVAQSLDSSMVTLSTGAVSAFRGAVAGTIGSANYQATAVAPSFTDISTTGTKSTTAVGDDSIDTLGAVQLGNFSFSYYGTAYTSISFNTNGLISFSTADAAWNNTDLSTSPAEPVIAVLWDDLNIDNSGTGATSRNIYWQVVGSGASQQLIIQWNNARQLSTSTYYTFQAVLSRDGTIQLNYGANVPTAAINAATVGVKGSGGNIPRKLLLSFNQAPSALVGAGLSTLLSPPSDYAAAVAAPAFTDISTTGNKSATAVGDDNTDTLSAAQLTGFAFPYYGATYNSLSFNTNGLITFTTADAAYLNTDLSSSPPEPAIAVLWDDLVMENTGTGTTSRNVYWQLVGSGANEQLIIQWNNARQYSGTAYYTFQAVLSQDGSIRFNYDASVPAAAIAAATAGVKGPGNNQQRLLLSNSQSASSLVGAGLSTVLSVPLTPDYYSFSLAANQSASIVVSGTSLLNFELRNSADAVLATATGGATNFSKTINNFTGAAGTYYLRVTGDGVSPYDLVVTKNAVFDTEANDTPATAQPLGTARGAMGYVVGGGTAQSSDLESGLAGWTINNGSTGLWGLTTRRGTEAGHSQTHSFHYGTDTGTYDTGAANAGAVTSAPFIVSPTMSLAFNYVLNTETSTAFDNANVQISVDGGTNWTTILGRTTGATPLANTSVWSPASVSLSAYVGQTAQVRFSFDTLDNIQNAFEGWYVDDISFNQTSNDDWYSVTLPAGITGLTLKTSTPGDGAGEFVNTLDPAIRLYNANGSSLLASGTPLPDGRNESLTNYNLTPGSTYLVQISGAALSRGEYFFTAEMLAAPTVTSVVLDEGSGNINIGGVNGTIQRSQVRRIIVNFSEAVSFTGATANAFTLTRSAASSSLGTTGPVTLAATPNSGPASSVTITFSGTYADSTGSLVDGLYNFSIDASKVSGTNGQLNGDSTGAGTNYTVTGTTANKWFRYYGDQNADGTVDQVDYLVFRNALSNGPSSVFDFDNSTGVDQVDYLEFRNRLSGSP